MKPWTNPEREIVFRMVEENKFHKEISDFLGQKGFERSPDAVRKLLKRTEYRNQTEIDGSVWDSIENIDPDYEEYDDSAHVAAFESITKQKEAMFDLCVRRFSKLGRPRGALKKIVTISDLHIPFENENIMADVINNHADADLLIINGDFFDLYSVSKWPKSKGFLLKHEYKIAVEWLKILSSKFKKIIFTSGNHDERMQSYFASNIDPAISFMVHPDCIERLVSGYSFDKLGNFVKMYDFKNVHYTSGLCSWYTKIGGVIFAHPSAFSKVPMRTAVMTCDYFLDKENFQAIVVAHSHHQGKVIWKNKLLIEQGCCCVPMDYEADGKMRFGQQTFGYAVVYMNKEGHVDYESTNPIYYGTGSAIKISSELP